MDQAQKKAGSPDSLSHKEKKANKSRTQKVRRQSQRVEHPEDLACMSHMVQAEHWMDPIGIIHHKDDNPLDAYE